MSRDQDHVQLQRNIWRLEALASFAEIMSSDPEAAANQLRRYLKKQLWRGEEDEIVLNEFLLGKIEATKVSDHFKE